MVAILFNKTIPSETSYLNSQYYRIYMLPELIFTYFPPTSIAAVILCDALAQLQDKDIYCAGRLQ